MTEVRELQARIAELEKECAYLGKQIAVQRDNRLAEFKAILRNVLRPSYLYLVEENEDHPMSAVLGENFRYQLVQMFEDLKNEGVDCARNGQ